MLGLVIATAVLVAIPGPNVALIVANTIQHGFRFGAITVLGTTLGVALQLAIVVLGLAAVLEYAVTAMLWVKWLGVAYLVYIGLRAWFEARQEFDMPAPSAGAASLLFWQGLGLGMINPKTLIFNAAFLPQFVSADAGAPELLRVAAIYVLVLFAGDLIWAATAERSRSFIQRVGALRNKIVGGLLVISGVGLALSRIGRL